MGKLKTEEYNKAYDLYCNTQLSQKDIAKVAGISAVQLNKWVKGNNWELDKTTQQVTAERVIRELYSNISDIHREAKEGKRKLTPAETDSIVKITASIKSLRKRYDLSSYHSILRECLEYMNKADNETAKLFAPKMLEFLREKSKALANDKTIG